MSLAVRLLTMYVILPSVFVLAGKTDPGCDKVKFSEQSSFVCRCSAKHCDNVAAFSKLPRGKYWAYVSDMYTERLTQFHGNFGAESGHQFEEQTEATLTVLRNVTYQEILGFGGAFTDAAGINIASLSPATQRQLISAYYSTDGIEYSIGRVPMASCDFSTNPYSYDDTPGDLELKNFKLTKEDIKYKIPFIHMAQNVSRHKLTMFASPWSAPSWMKTNKKMNGKGSLIGQPGGKYYHAWAKYFAKFLAAYKSNGIKFWGVTAQNEPTNGCITNFSFQATCFTAQVQRDFIAQDLGPVLEQEGFKDVKIMILDDQRPLLPYWAEQVLKDETANKYVAGIGVHWYLDQILPVPSILTKTHELFPDKFILATEACTGSSILDPHEHKVMLGSWERFESYVHDIIQDLNNWVVGWVDWNLALDKQGGPNWVSNFVDSPIIVDAPSDQFYKQPMFYAMAHFSKFVPPGSKRIDVKLQGNTNLEYVAFITPDNAVVLQLYNWKTEKTDIMIKDATSSVSKLYTVRAKSLHTLIWW